MVLSIMARRGEVEPANVARIHPLPEPSVIDRTPALLLAVAVWATIPKERQADVRGQIGSIASTERCPHALAVARLLGKL